MDTLFSYCCKKKHLLLFDYLVTLKDKRVAPMKCKSLDDQRNGHYCVPGFLFPNEYTATIKYFHADYMNGMNYYSIHKRTLFCLIKLLNYNVRSFCTDGFFMHIKYFEDFII